MKVGFDYPKCIIDVYEGTINIGQVLLIVQNEGFDVDPTNDSHWNMVWNNHIFGITGSPWIKYVDQVSQIRSVAIELEQAGLVHQTKKILPKTPHHWLELMIPHSEMENNPAIKDAWEKYQMIAKLCSEL